MIAETQSISTGVVVACVVVNLVLAIAQVFRYSWKINWAWWFRNTWAQVLNWDTWAQLLYWNTWARLFYWNTWARMLRKIWARLLDGDSWSFIQISCYTVAVVITSCLWQHVPSASYVALQCLLDVSWLNSVSGQSRMLHEIFDNEDRASLVHLSSLMAVIIQTAGFVIMELPDAIPAARCLIFASTFVFYSITGIATNSIYLNPQTRSAKSIVFMSVFMIAVVSVVVGFLLSIHKDNDFFLLVMSLTVGCAYSVLSVQQPIWRLTSYAIQEIRLAVRPSQVEVLPSTADQVSLTNSNIRLSGISKFEPPIVEDAASYC